MDEISRGLDEMALGASDNNNLAAHHLPVALEACGCAEISGRTDEAVGGLLATPLHRCKGRHHLPIIGEEMQGDQPIRIPKPGDQDSKAPLLGEKNPQLLDSCDTFVSAPCCQHIQAAKPSQTSTSAEQLQEQTEQKSPDGQLDSVSKSDQAEDEERNGASEAAGNIQSLEKN